MHAPVVLAEGAKHPTCTGMSSGERRTSHAHIFASRLRATFMFLKSVSETERVTMSKLKNQNRKFDFLAHRNMRWIRKTTCAMGMSQNPKMGDVAIHDHLKLLRHRGTLQAGTHASPPGTRGKPSYDAIRLVAIRDWLSMAHRVSAIQYYIHFIWILLKTHSVSRWVKLISPINRATGPLILIITQLSLSRNRSLTTL